MGTLNSETKAYLFQLCSMAQGDPLAQVSMYEVGEALGLERSEAGSLAEALFIEEYAELKTLSGGIGWPGNGVGFYLGAGTDGSHSGNYW